MEDDVHNHLALTRDASQRKARTWVKHFSTHHSQVFNFFKQTKCNLCLFLKLWSLLCKWNSTHQVWVYFDKTTFQIPHATIKSGHVVWGFHKSQNLVISTKTVPWNLKVLEIIEIKAYRNAKNFCPC